ncbi:MAG: M23 family metallopeptidase [Bacteroidetes bacterium]|nr:MAG: M23 family metallopeptidase [Bacteroidota bacterium]
MEEKKKSAFWTKIRNRYRLVVMNDDTFEEQFSLKLTPLNIFILTGLVSIIMITLTVSLVAFTPLRAYIPGYESEINTRKELINLTLKLDSLQNELKLGSAAMENIKNIMSGNIGNDTIPSPVSPKAENAPSPSGKAGDGVTPSREDSIFRAQIESQDKYSLAFSERKAGKESISSFFFFTPVKGMVTASFNSAQEHYGTDIVAKENEPIKATLDGTVLFAGWTSETGFTIQIQHSNNLVSAYKHNSVLLKKAGQFVKAGETIAVIGNSGEQSNGPHLHFELWYNGKAIDPQEYMVF